MIRRPSSSTRQRRAAAQRPLIPTVPCQPTVRTRTPAPPPMPMPPPQTRPPLAVAPKRNISMMSEALEVTQRLGHYPILIGTLARDHVAHQHLRPAVLRHQRGRARLGARTRVAHILGGMISSTSRFPRHRWEIVKNLRFFNEFA